MRRHLSLLVLIALLAPASVAVSQETYADDDLSPGQFSGILKEAWTFLRDGTGEYLASISAKGEFETTPEFEERVARERMGYINKVNAYIKEQKLDTRVLGILLKATPSSYDADKQLYMVACSVQVEAPYTIPSLLTYVPGNSFLRVQDTIVGGYRTSRLMLKFSPYFRWTVDRPVAMEAKAAEPSLFFRIRVMIDISQPNIKDQALLRIVPKEIMLTNTEKGTVHWREEIR